MATGIGRREFIRHLGVSAAILPFLTGLSAVRAGETPRRKQRLVVVFSPNGIVPKTFWPDEEGENFTLKESLAPLEKSRAQEKAGAKTLRVRRSVFSVRHSGRLSVLRC